MIKSVTYLLSICLIFSSIVFGAETATKEKNHYLFVGNPGVGKSAIINGLVGKKVFASGLCIGTGLTTHLQCCEHEGNVFIDTPGLADMEKKEAAAKEIEKALKMGGKYHLFFVFNLNELRIVEQDLITMELVLDALQYPKKEFNIIINKIDDDEKQELQDMDNLAALLLMLKKQKYSTDAIWFLDKNRDLRLKKTDILPLDEKTINFIFNLSKSMTINSDKVKRIEWDKYEELRKTTTRKISCLEQEIANNSTEIVQLRKSLHNTKDEYDAIVRKAEKEKKEAKIEHDTLVDKINAVEKIAADEHKALIRALDDAKMVPKPQPIILPQPIVQPEIRYVHVERPAQKSL